MIATIKSFTFWAYAFVLTLILNNIVSAAESEQKEKKVFPVQWEEQLIPYYLKEKAGSVKDFKRLLEAHWKEDDESDFNFVVEFHDGTVLKEKKIKNCDDLMSSFKTISNIKTKDISYNNMLGWRSSCEGMKQMLQMRDSRGSFVSFDVKTLLDGLSNVRIESEDETYKYFFKDLNKVIKLKCKRQSMCIVTTKNQIMRIQVDAIGDFNHDGIQDAMILANSGPRIGRGDWFIGMIITRVKEEGEVKVLKWW